MAGYYPSKSKKSDRSSGVLAGFEEKLRAKHQMARSNFAKGGKTKSAMGAMSDRDRSDDDSERDERLATINRATENLALKNREIDFAKSIHPSVLQNMSMQGAGQPSPTLPLTPIPPGVGAGSALAPAPAMPGVPGMIPGPMGSMPPMPSSPMAGGPMPPPMSPGMPGMPPPGVMPPQSSLQGPQVAQMMAARQAAQGVPPPQPNSWLANFSGPNAIADARAQREMQNKLQAMAAIQALAAKQQQQAQQLMNAQGQVMPYQPPSQPPSQPMRFAEGDRVPVIVDENEPGAILKATPTREIVVPSAPSAAAVPPPSAAAPSVGAKPSKPSFDVNAALEKAYLEAGEGREAQKRLLAEEISSRKAVNTDPFNSRSALLKVASALLKPTKSGSFGESLGEATGALAGSISDMEQVKQAQNAELLKLKLEEAKLKGSSLSDLKEIAGAQAQLRGKDSAILQAIKEAYPDDPAKQAEALQAYVAAQTAKGAAPAPGGFDRKTGNFIAPNGSVIKSNEVKEDRQERDAMVKLQDSLGKLTPDVVKQAEGWDWTGSDTTKFIAGKLMPKQLAAQTTVNAASLQERLKNLPPGPASDKDIAQARSSFPGFSDAKALQGWIDLTNAAVNSYIRRQDMKYGDAQWYGSSGTAPGKPTDEKTSEKGAAGDKGGAPKIGDIKVFRGGLRGQWDGKEWKPV